jgi:hypothetical protein
VQGSSKQTINKLFGKVKLNDLLKHGNIIARSMGLIKGLMILYRKGLMQGLMQSLMQGLMQSLMQGLMQSLMQGLMQSLMILYRKGFYITITYDVYTRGYPSKQEMSLIMRNESYNEK